MAIQQLTARFRVSRTPLAHALELLHRDGLVEISPRSGTTVRSITARDVAEYFQARAMIESFAARLVVPIAPMAARNRLESAVIGFRNWLAQPGSEDPDRLDEWLHLESQFHETLVIATGNRLLIDIYERLRAHIYVIQSFHLRALALPSEIQVEHEELLEAFKRCDSERFVNVLERHIARTGTDIQRVIDATGANL